MGVGEQHSEFYWGHGDGWLDLEGSADMRVHTDA